MYNDVISWWISHKEDMDVYVVDSFGRPFCDLVESECRVLHFAQESTLLSSSFLELNSLQKILSHYKELSEYDYIVKLTSKYTLPTLRKELSSVLANQHPSTLMVTQNKDGTVGHRHCEIVVYRGHDMQQTVDQLMELVLSQNIILERALRIFVDRNNITATLPDLINLSCYKRGAGDYMQYL